MAFSHLVFKHIDRCISRPNVFGKWVRGFPNEARTAENNGGSERLKRWDWHKLMYTDSEMTYFYQEK